MFKATITIPAHSKRLMPQKLLGRNMTLIEVANPSNKPIVVVCEEDPDAIHHIIKLKLNGGKGNA